MRRILIILQMAFLSSAMAQFDFDLGDDIEIPNICQHIEDFVTPVDLSASCLAAQVAAQGNPLLEPAANRLCQILEGATATLGVLQLEINTIYETCQLEINKIQRELTEGVTGHANLLNSEITKRLRLMDALSFDELEEKGMSTPVAGISIDRWDELIDQTPDENVRQAKKQLLREVAKSNYVANRFLLEGLADGMINMVVDLLGMTGSDLSVKGSQDLQVRLNAELVYQQQAFQQIINQYLALVAVQEQKRMASERFNHQFLNGDDE
jgi:hypothetical protein